MKLEVATVAKEGRVAKKILKGYTAMLRREAFRLTPLRPRVPIGSFLEPTAPKGKIAAAVRPSLEALELLLDVEMPPIPLRSVRTRRGGCYKSQGAVPTEIAISTLTDTPALDVVHEVAHALDHQILRDPDGSPKEFGSSSAEFKPLLELIRASAAHKHLKEVALKAVIDPTMMLPFRALSYLESTPECFARAFTQWVGDKTTVPALRAEVLYSKQHSSEGSILPVGWDDPADFAPIAAELERLLGERGLLRRS